MITGIQISSLAPLMKDAEGFETCVKNLTHIGFRHTQLQWIDPSVKADEIGFILRKYGMKSLGTQEKYDQLIARFDDFIKINHNAGSKEVCFSTIPDRYFEEKTLYDFIDEMKENMKILEKENLYASFHPTFKDFRIHSGKYACDILFESIPELMIVPDTNQLIRAGVDVKIWLKKHKDRIRMIHFKDMIYQGGIMKLVPAGKGITDFKSIIPILKDIGNEYILAEQETWEGDPFERIKESFDFIETIK